MGSDKTIDRVLQEWAEVFMRRSFRDFKHFMDRNGLSASQLGTLMQLHRHQCFGISDIADHMRITAPAASQLVDRLVTQGLLARTEDPNDRRCKQVSMTERGIRLVEDGIRARQAWLEQLTSAFTAEEQERIIEVLVRLTEAARQLEAERVA